MSCIRGNVKKGLGQSGLFSDEKLHYKLTGMSHNILCHAFRGTQRRTEETFNGDKKKKFLK